MCLLVLWNSFILKRQGHGPLYITLCFTHLVLVFIHILIKMLFVDIRTLNGSPNRVSFSANVHNSHLTLGVGQTVIYDNILTNNGNGYDDRSGIFTCPVAGTYMFVVDSLSYPGIWLKLKLNKQEVARLHVSPLVKDKWSLTQISRTVILNLKVGDHVKVENIYKDGMVYAHRYSGFSGTLL